MTQDITQGATFVFLVTVVPSILIPTAFLAYSWEMRNSMKLNSGEIVGFCTLLAYKSMLIIYCMCISVSKKISRPTKKANGSKFQLKVVYYKVRSWHINQENQVSFELWCCVHIFETRIGANCKYTIQNMKTGIETHSAFFCF